MHDPRQQSPFNQLPPVVVALAVVIGGVELMFQAAEVGLIGGRTGRGWRLNAITDWAVLDVVFGWMLSNGTFPLRELARWLTFPLLHGGFTHAVFVVVFVLALGNVTAGYYPRWRLPVVFWGASVAGGLAYVILYNVQAPLYGGYPGVYGFLGVFTYMTRRGLTRADPSQAFLLIGFLLAIQPIFGLGTGQGFAWVPTWTADAAGAAAGYGLAALLFPGGASGLLSRLRQR